MARDPQTPPAFRMHQLLTSMEPSGQLLHLFLIYFFPEVEKFFGNKKNENPLGPSLTLAIYKALVLLSFTPQQSIKHIYHTLAQTWAPVTMFTVIL